MTTRKTAGQGGHPDLQHAARGAVTGGDNHRRQRGEADRGRRAPAVQQPIQLVHTDRADRDHEQRPGQPTEVEEDDGDDRGRDGDQDPRPELGALTPGPGGVALGTARALTAPGPSWPLGALSPLGPVTRAALRPLGALGAHASGPLGPGACLATQRAPWAVGIAVGVAPRARARTVPRVRAAAGGHQRPPNRRRRAANSSSVCSKAAREKSGHSSSRKANSE